MPTDFSAQKGFTLIELMIAITLGLLVSAAALMIFLNSQRSLAIQGGMGEIDQNTIFGLNRLTRDLRHINLDTNTAHISIGGINSGIIFDVSQSPAVTIPATAVSLANANAGLYDTQSDQLTIQYTTRNDTTDCEGNATPADTRVVQRYYVDALPANQQSGSDVRYGLYCDAIWNGSAINANQTVIIPDVEIFKVSLLTRNFNNTVADRTDDTLRYQTLGEYIAGSTGNTVISLEVGVVMRSSNSVHADRNIDLTRPFNIAGHEVKLTNTTGSARFLRMPINQVVAIRNAQGLV
ncbi:MAG: prepilin-type N-terminal cleavage/methylation domain-containing protein [Moraxella sp.]|nr:prepilin-type N-terminal cleavage/methylation domain-containing protein [Moraxella sp.]